MIRTDIQPANVHQYTDMYVSSDAGCLRVYCNGKIYAKCSEKYSVNFLKRISAFFHSEDKVSSSLDGRRLEIRESWQQGAAYESFSNMLKYLCGLLPVLQTISVYECLPDDLQCKICKTPSLEDLLQDDRCVNDKEFFSILNVYREFFDRDVVRPIPSRQYHGYVEGRVMKAPEVLGDIHGGVKGLRDFLKKHISGGSLNKNIVFLGDYVDRLPNSREAFSIVLTLLMKFPDKIVALRGNHEYLSQNISEFCIGATRECGVKNPISYDRNFAQFHYPPSFNSSALKDAYNRLPLALAIIDPETKESSLYVHGVPDITLEWRKLLDDLISHSSALELGVDQVPYSTYIMVPKTVARKFDDISDLKSLRLHELETVSLAEGQFREVKAQIEILDRAYVEMNRYQKPELIDLRLSFDVSSHESYKACLAGMQKARGIVELFCPDSCDRLFQLTAAIRVSSIWQRIRQDSKKIGLGEHTPLNWGDMKDVTALGPLSSRGFSISPTDIIAFMESVGFSKLFKAHQHIEFKFNMDSREIFSLEWSDEIPHLMNLMKLSDTNVEVISNED